MTSEREKEANLEKERRFGRVIAVCLSDKKEYPKYPQEKVIVGPHGIVGDAHAGELRRSYREPNRLVVNDRAVSIVSYEVREELSLLIGREIPAGAFNENILIWGLGDLSDFEGGEEIHLSGGVILKVTRQNTPCRKLEEYLGKEGVIKALINKSDDGVLNKRGLVATVLQIGEIEPGEKVEIIKAKPENS